MCDFTDGAHGRWLRTRRLVAVFYCYYSPVGTLLEPGVRTLEFGSPFTVRNYEQNCESVPFSEEALELSPNS